MSHFLHHESCPQCGSRDNLGRYSDGSAFCFGCHHWEPPTTAPWVKEVDGYQEDDKTALTALLEASSPIFGFEAIYWLKQYGIVPEETHKYGWKWNEQRKQLLIPILDGNGALLGIQARNFADNAKSRYFNIGTKDGHVSFYGRAEKRSLVVVEDAVSALKVSFLVQAYPLFGSALSKQALLLLKQKCDKIVVWLDRDKWKEAQDVADSAKWIGFEATTLLTELDPKCYTIDEIQKYLGIDKQENIC